MKFMNQRRFGAAAMAGALALSMALPAYAAATTPSYKTTINGAYSAPTLNVTVPGTVTAVVNPYGLPFDLVDGEVTIKGDNAKISTGSAMLIENRSGSALKVGAKVKGTVKGSGVAFDTASVADNETSKKIYANFEAFNAPTLNEDNFSDEATVANLFKDLKSNDAVLKVNVAAAEAAATDANGGLILREGADDALQNGSVGVFRLNGNATKKPSTDWASGDGFTVEITFSFEPAEYMGTSLGALAATPTSLSLAGTKAGTVTAPTMPTGVTAKKTTYSSSDESILTVNPTTGAYEGKATGSADVIVMIEGSNKQLYSAKATITVAS